MRYFLLCIILFPSQIVFFFLFGGIKRDFIFGWVKTDLGKYILKVTRLDWWMHSKLSFQTFYSQYNILLQTLNNKHTVSFIKKTFCWGVLKYQFILFILKLEEGEIDVRLSSFKGCVVKQLQEQESRNRGL